MRTDRTFVCTDCRVRCWPVRRCPVCGTNAALVDLEQHPDAIERAPRGPAESRSAGLRAKALGALGGAIWLGGGLSGSLGIAEVGLVVGAPLVLLGLLLHPRTRAPRTYRMLDAPVVRSSAPRTTARGFVRGEATLTAPLSGRSCIAFRLVGSGSLGAIDDASGVPFAIDTTTGETIAVDGATAAFRLPVTDARTRPSLPAPLAPWLRARGIDPGDANLVLAEGILSPGAEVEVHGAPVETLVFEGFRGQARERSLRDAPGSPLVVDALPDRGGR